MAILRDDQLSLEFVFKEVDDCLWLQYELYFRWDDHDVFHDELLKRSPIGWAGRTKNALMANEHQEDSFLPILEKAVDALEPLCWEPSEPDIKIAFYPEQSFPFIPNRYKEIYVSDYCLRQREERRLRKARNNGRLPDDVITMIVFADSYNFKDCGVYCGSGFGMFLSPTRAQLSTFYTELKCEYDAFVAKENLAERLAAAHEAELKAEAEAEQDYFTTPR